MEGLKAWFTRTVVPNSCRVCHLCVSDESDNESLSSNRHHHHHHPSTSKNHRSLPPRGSVDDLFNPSSVESDNAVQTKEDDTIKFVAKRKRAKNAALPPKSRYDLLTFVGGTISDGYLDFSASMLACAHGFPFSSSPEHTGTTYGHLHAADYEIGFRYRTRSPRSQVFVVRHNPSSPPNALRVDEPNSNSKRLLPFPPVTGETHLHHPKRRTLVGNIDNPSVTYSGSLDVRVKGHETLATDSTTSGTEGYETRDIS